MIRRSNEAIDYNNLLGRFVADLGLVSSTLFESGMIISFNRLPYIPKTSYLHHLVTSDTSPTVVIVS